MHRRVAQRPLPKQAGTGYIAHDVMLSKRESIPLYHVMRVPNTPKLQCTQKTQSIN